MGAARHVMHPGCVTPSESPQNGIKPLNYDFVVQPRNGSETVIEVVLMPFKVVEVLNIPSYVLLRHPTSFGARVPGTSKTVTYRLQFRLF